MEQFLKVIGIAWNPVGEIRRRGQEHELYLTKTIGPFLGIAIACQLFYNTALLFFVRTLAWVGGDKLQDHPLLSTFPQQMLVVICVSAATLGVAVLPRSVFQPSDRSAVLSALLIVWAGGAFYQAALGSMAFFVAGVLLAVNVQLGLGVFALLGGLTSVIVLVLLATFWFRATTGVLLIGAARVTVISIAAAGGFAVAVTFWMTSIIAARG